MNVTIMQKHIDSGAPRSCGKCPVALAVNDATGLVTASASIDEIRVGVTVCIVPREVQTFIGMFDIYGPDRVEPLTFELEPLA